VVSLDELETYMKEWGHGAHLPEEWKRADTIGALLRLARAVIQNAIDRQEDCPACGCYAFTGDEETYQPHAPDCALVAVTGRYERW
jgi:hypothetical protein